MYLVVITALVQPVRTGVAVITIRWMRDFCVETLEEALKKGKPDIFKY